MKNKNDICNIMPLGNKSRDCTKAAALDGAIGRGSDLSFRGVMMLGFVVSLRFFFVPYLILGCPVFPRWEDSRDNPVGLILLVRRK